MFCLNSTLNFGIRPVLVFQLEFYYKVDRCRRWYSNKDLYPILCIQPSQLFEWQLVATLLHITPESQGNFGNITASITLLM